MKLIPPAHRQKLLENGFAQRAAIDRQDQALDFEPVVKLFTPDANAIWRGSTRPLAPSASRSTGE